MLQMLPHPLSPSPMPLPGGFINQTFADFPSYCRELAGQLAALSI